MFEIFLSPYKPHIAFKSPNHLTNDLERELDLYLPIFISAAAAMANYGRH